MWRKIKNNFGKRYKWLQENAMKVFVVIVMHMVLTYLLSLPYLNLLNIFFGFIIFLIDWIIILILFKPGKENILKAGLWLFVIGFPFAVIDAKFSLEILGNVSYMLIATYIFFAFSEIKSK